MIVDNTRSRSVVRLSNFFLSFIIHFSSRGAPIILSLPSVESPVVVEMFNDRLVNSPSKSAVEGVEARSVVRRTIAVVLVITGTVEGEGLLATVAMGLAEDMICLVVVLGVVVVVVVLIVVLVLLVVVVAVVVVLVVVVGVVAVVAVVVFVVVLRGVLLDVVVVIGDFVVFLYSRSRADILRSISALHPLPCSLTAIRSRTLLLQIYSCVSKGQRQ